MERGVGAPRHHQPHQHPRGGRRRLLAEGAADMVLDGPAHARRPHDFVAKATAGRREAINTCIGCNQACLDHTFGSKITSCLVSPRACATKTELVLAPTRRHRRVAVVGAGPAGLACAVSAARPSPRVTLFDAARRDRRPAQRRPQGPRQAGSSTRRCATSVPGLAEHGVDVRLNTRVGADDLAGHDEVIVATGVTPRTPDIPGVDHPSVVGYLDVLRDGAPSVTASRSSARAASASTSPSTSPTAATRRTRTPRRTSPLGRRHGLPRAGRPRRARAAIPPRTRAPAQRKTSKVGAGLGKTTGWIHRTELKRGVTMVPGVRYDRIDGTAGLHITIGDESTVLEVDLVVLCTESRSRAGACTTELVAAGAGGPHLIGGADVARRTGPPSAPSSGSTELAAAPVRAARSGRRAGRP
ncbi:FAD-dependent oxidoreductase [Streptomyces thinghirensis]|nr:FAD-dependent oxidoreductase [Streptomyces thinghirensis]